MLENHPIYQDLITPKVIKSFKDKCHKIPGKDGCIRWKASVGTDGYGQLWVGGKNYLAHRVSYFLHNNNIDNSLVVLHKCDTPRCVNPKHLFLGTKHDNSQDMLIKGRQARGELNINAKLTKAIALKIREEYAQGKVSQQKLGRKYNVKQTTVSDIILRKLWSHV